MLHRPTVHQNTWKSSDICAKCTDMGVIWLFFPRGFLYMQIVKKELADRGRPFECLEALGR